MTSYLAYKRWIGEITTDEFIESEHPRDDLGRFTNKDSVTVLRVKHRNCDTPLLIDVKQVDNIKEYRIKQLGWYRKNLQGKKVLNNKLGGILFSLSGGNILYIMLRDKN